MKLQSKNWDRRDAGRVSGEFPVTFYGDDLVLHQGHGINVSCSGMRMVCPGNSVADNLHVRIELAPTLTVETVGQKVWEQPLNGSTSILGVQFVVLQERQRNALLSFCGRNRNENLAPA